MSWTRAGRTHSYSDNSGRVTLTRHSAGSHVASLKLYIKPAYRGAGNGRRLVSRALDFARTAGISRVEATPYIDNYISTRFFDRDERFHYEGRRRKGGNRDGTLVDTWLYAWTE